MLPSLLHPLDLYTPMFGWFIVYWKHFSSWREGQWAQNWYWRSLHEKTCTGVLDLLRILHSNRRCIQKRKANSRMEQSNKGSSDCWRLRIIEIPFTEKKKRETSFMMKSLGLDVWARRQRRWVEDTWKYRRAGSSLPWASRREPPWVYRRVVEAWSSIHFQFIPRLDLDELIPGSKKLIRTEGLPHGDKRKSKRCSALIRQTKSESFQLLKNIGQQKNYFYQIPFKPLFLPPQTNKKCK